MIQRIRQRITELLTTASNVVSHRVHTVTTRIRRAFRQPSNDWRRADYRYWRLAYRCQVRGLELSGLFIKPLVNKVATWTLGRAPGWKCESEASQEALETWWDDHHAEVLRTFRAALKQGDSFLVVNPDLTVTLLQPDTVDPIVAEDDYSLVIGWRVTQVLAHPERTADKMTMIDEYYADRRVHRIERNGITDSERVFPNLLGRPPIVHIANELDEGESFGHPEAEAIVEILHRYGEILEAAVEGNKLQGRPTPVMSFETIQDLDKFWALYGTTERRELPDGSTESNKVLAVDLSQLLTVSGAEFQYASPGNFAGDTQVLLKLMFYLILEHTEIPEFVLGNAIASSKASAESQMPVFEKFIEGRRGDTAPWLIEIATIVLAYKSLIEPGVSAEEPALQWQKLTQDGRLTLDTITWALAEGLLDERTALMLAPIDVDDIDQVLEKAKEEREEREAKQQAQMQDEAQFDADLRREINDLEI